MKTRILIFSLLVCASCRQTDAPPRQPLSDDRFRSIYIALLEKGERWKTFPGDTSHHFNADSIFQAFRTSESEFRLTVESYRGDPKKWQAFYEGVVKNLEEKEKQQSARPKL